MPHFPRLVLVRSSVAGSDPSAHRACDREGPSDRRAADRLRAIRHPSYRHRPEPARPDAVGVHARTLLATLLAAVADATGLSGVALRAGLAEVAALLADVALALTTLLADLAVLTLLLLAGNVGVLLLPEREPPMYSSPHSKRRSISSRTHARRPSV